MRPPPVPPLDDAAAMAVYADLLTDRGDPRGELVQLQLRREERPHEARLAHAEAQCLAQHSRALLGPLRNATSQLELTWRRGYVVQATVRSLAHQITGLYGRNAVQVKAPRLARRVRELLTLESAAPLSALSLQLPPSNFAARVLLDCVNEVAQAAPNSLRTLGVHLLVRQEYDWEYGDWEAGPTEAVEVGALQVCAAPVLLGDVVRRLSRG